MIVNLVEPGWEIIYHRAHALLAAQIAAYWPRSESTTRRVETVAAISHHDDLEREWEGNHLTSAGAPLDFTLLSADPPEPDVTRLVKHVEAAQYRGRWVALLTSMHLCFLQQPQRDQSEAIAQFLADQEQQQQQWRQGLGLSQAQAEQAYAFMRWCDRLSLILCQRQLPARERALEITQDGRGQRYDVVQRPDGTINVRPWPFESEHFNVWVEATYLDQLQFEDQAALVRALQAAPIQTLEWTFTRDAGSR